MENQNWLFLLNSFVDEEQQDDDDNEEQDSDDQIDESADDDDDIVMPSSSSKSHDSKKSGKKGIIYISSIPKHMNVTRCRELLETYGEIGRIFLQADQKGSKSEFTFIFPFIISFITQNLFY